MPSRHQSFALSRPGLKPGHYVPLRLRIVDTLTIVSWLPMVISILAFAILALRVAGDFGVIVKNPIAVCICLLAALFVAGWAIPLNAMRTLRFLFRVLGMMTAEEEESFPLDTENGDLAPWPDSWQKPYDPF